MICRDTPTHGWVLGGWVDQWVSGSCQITKNLINLDIIAGSLESANSSILAARRHFKEVVGKKIRILL